MTWKVTEMGKHARGNNRYRFLQESGTGEQVAFLNSILESSTEYSIVATDLAGTILAWNEGARRIYVWTRASYLTSEDQSRLADAAPLVVLKGRGGVEPLVKALQTCLPASP